MTTLYCTRGLPGCGKTTWTRGRLLQARDKLARVNRDDLRWMLHDAYSHAPVTEQQVTTAQHAAIEALLRSGVDAICDDTNLRARPLRTLAASASKVGAGI